jgi:hypothetical protein
MIRVEMATRRAVPEEIVAKLRQKHPRTLLDPLVSYPSWRLPLRPLHFAPVKGRRLRIDDPLISFS